MLTSWTSVSPRSQAMMRPITPLVSKSIQADRGPLLAPKGQHGRHAELLKASMIELQPVFHHLFDIDHHVPLRNACGLMEEPVTL